MGIRVTSFTVDPVLTRVILDQAKVTSSTVDPVLTRVVLDQAQVTSSTVDPVLTTVILDHLDILLLVLVSVTYGSLDSGVVLKCFKTAVTSSAEI